MLAHPVQPTFVSPNASKNEFYGLTGVTRSPSAIWKVPRQIEYSLQKVTYIAAEQNAEERRDYIDTLQQIVQNPSMMIYLDETAKDQNSARRRRIWATQGSKAEFAQPLSTGMESRFCTLPFGIQMFTFGIPLPGGASPVPNTTEVLGKETICICNDIAEGEGADAAINPLESELL